MIPLVHIQQFEPRGDRVPDMRVPIRQLVEVHILIARVAAARLEHRVTHKLRRPVRHTRDISPRNTGGLPTEGQQHTHEGAHEAPQLSASQLPAAAAAAALAIIEDIPGGGQLGTLGSATKPVSHSVSQSVSQSVSRPIDWVPISISMSQQHITVSKLSKS